MIAETILMKADQAELTQILERLSKRIAPVWPLKNMVAVNPFYGYSDQTFEGTAGYLKELTTIQLYMPLSFYLQQIKDGIILEEDIQEAVQFTGKKEYSSKQILLDLCNEQLIKEPQLKPRIQTIADQAGNKLKLNYNNLFTEGVTSWVSMYFNEVDNPYFPQNKTQSLFQSWKEYAIIDKLPRVAGIKTFKKTVESLPENALDAMNFILDQLPIQEKEDYLVCLTYKLIGWSSYIAGYDWDNQLYKGRTQHLQEFVAVLLSWEFAIYQSLENTLIFDVDDRPVKDSVQSNLKNKTDESLHLKHILQTALDLANQRILRFKFDVQPQLKKVSVPPTVQAVFCIDVRSEVYRRHLEATGLDVQTLGFAGFFGFPVKYEPIGLGSKSNLCPVLLPAGPTVSETADKKNTDLIWRKRSFFTQFKKSVKGFRKGPVSSFGFVSPLGIFYLPKLMSDSFRFTNPVIKTEKTGYRTSYLQERKIDVSGIRFADQLKMASGALRNMGLTSNFAPLVLLTGHGSSSVNNPHAGSLECGACGGYSGDVNALTAATILNNEHIRIGLQGLGIEIPNETVFLAALHDTSTDHIEILNRDSIKEVHRERFENLLQHLKTATINSNIERAKRFNKFSEGSVDHLEKRSRDWSQTRPEWGLAGCNTFIIANRIKTKNITLNSQSFLHDYDFEKDIDLNILESILTAPMIVTSWINLQYYASTVAPNHFGAGNKTLHNVTSNIGVIEGSGGDLRIGLPFQSVSRGTKLEHIPQRLTVVIDAPIEAINRLLEKHASVKSLFDNQWIYLMQLDQFGKINNRYNSDLKWESLS